MFDEADRETGFALFLVIARSRSSCRWPRSALRPEPSSATLALAKTGCRRVCTTRVGRRGRPDRRERHDFAKWFVRAAGRRVDSRRAAGKTAADGSRFTVSGFHDASGDATANAELAKRRALAVRDLLTTAGVAPDRIELRKPALTTGGADPREARRVEVTLE
jgi:hypothetical protein